MYHGYVESAEKLEERRRRIAAGTYRRPAADQPPTKSEPGKREPAGSGTTHHAKEGSNR